MNKGSALIMLCLIINVLFCTYLYTGENISVQDNIGDILTSSFYIAVFFFFLKAFSIETGKYNENIGVFYEKFVTPIISVTIPLFLDNMPELIFSSESIVLGICLWLLLVDWEKRIRILFLENEFVINEKKYSPYDYAWFTGMIHICIFYVVIY